MEKREKIRIFLVSVGLGVGIFIALAIVLGLAKAKTEVQLIGTTDSLEIELNGGLDLKLEVKSLNLIQLRAAELHCHYLDTCKIVLQDDQEIIITPSSSYEEDIEFRLLSCLENDYLILRSRTYEPIQATFEEWGTAFERGESRFGEGHIYTDNNVKMAISCKQINPRVELTVFAVCGLSYPGDSFLCQIRLPGSVSHRTKSGLEVEFFKDSAGATYAYVYPECQEVYIKADSNYWAEVHGSQFMVWGVVDDSAYFSTRPISKISSSKILFGCGVITMEPALVTSISQSSGWMSPCMRNSSFGFASGFGWTDGPPSNLLISKGKSIKHLSTKAIQDSLILQINSPRRPAPFILKLGDEISIAGEFNFETKSRENYMEVWLKGRANSVKINGAEFIPSILESMRDTLLAIAAILVGLGALVSLLWNFFVKWPSEQRPQKSSRPKRRKTAK